MSYIDDLCLCGHSRMDHWYNNSNKRWWNFLDTSFVLGKCHNIDCRHPFDVGCKKFKMDNLKYLEERLK